MTAEWEAAARAGNRAELEALLQAGADPNARDRYGQTALMLAAHAGHGEAVRALIAAGADLDVSAKFGLTATMLAVVQGHGAVARALAEAGADLHATGSGAPGFAGKTAAVLARDLKQEALALALDPEDRRRPAD